MEYYKEQCQCGYCFPEGKALWICDKSPHYVYSKKKPYLVRLILILFVPRKEAREHFTIEELPIGWVIIGLSLIVNLILRLF